MLRRALQVLVVVALIHGAEYLLRQLARARSLQLLGELVNRVPTAERVVALTFDDGPEPGQTEDVLAILSRERVLATFFLVGREIDRHPELARRIVAAGHEVGNHSYSHRRMVLHSPAFIREE